LAAKDSDGSCRETPSAGWSRCGFSAAFASFQCSYRSAGSAYDLLDQVPRDVVDVEVLGERGVQERLEQEVAQLLPQLLGVVAADGVQDLVGLLEQVRAERPVRLGLVPRAAVLGVQARDGLDQVEQAGAGRIPRAVDDFELDLAARDVLGEGLAQLLVALLADDPDSAGLDELGGVIDQLHVDPGVAHGLDGGRLEERGDGLGLVQGVPGLDGEQAGGDAGGGQEPGDGAQRCGTSTSNTPASGVMSSSP
jgi:hypothetical protein